MSNYKNFNTLKNIFQLIKELLSKYIPIPVFMRKDNIIFAYIICLRAI